MQTVDFQTLLQKTWGLLTGVTTDPDVADYPGLLGYFDLSLGEIWDLEQWPELTKDEQRQMRDSYDPNATYQAGAEVLFVDSQLYYVAVRSGGFTNQPPATLSSGAYVTNTAYWAQAFTQPANATNYDATRDYNVGDQFFYPSTQKVYQCHTAASAGTLPTNTSYFGEVPRFDPYVAYEQTINGVVQTKIGDVFLVTTDSTRISMKYREVRWQLSEDGIQFPAGAARCAAPATVWVQFRERRPLLSGAVLDTTKAYATGAQVYFVPSVGNGNLYDCVTSASAGETPDSAPAKWSVVQIPLRFQGYLIWSAYSKALVADGQPEKSSGAQQMADKYLAIETKKLYEVQGQQNRPLRLKVY